MYALRDRKLSLIFLQAKLVDNARMSSRQCFSCTACCEGWLSSPHIEMSPGKPCSHCTQQGCAIYENRPVDPCVGFKCGWLAEPSPLPDEMRPDLCGAIISFTWKWNGWTVVKAVPAGECIPDDTLEWLKAYAREKGIPLLFSTRLLKDGQFHGHRKLGYGPADFIHAVENEIGPEDIMTL